MDDQRPDVPNMTTPGRHRISLALDRAHARLLRGEAHARQFASRHKYTVRALTACVLLLVVLSGWFLYQVLAGLPTRDQMRELAETAEGTMVFDAHDRQIFAIPTQYRVEVELARMSPHLRDAVIAVEDARFYDHDGIDGIRVIGAPVQDIRQGRAAEGASTIRARRESVFSRATRRCPQVRDESLAAIREVYARTDPRDFLNRSFLRLLLA